MSWESLFEVMSRAAMLAWVILLLAPRRWTWLGLLPRLVIPGGIALVYAGLMGAYFVASGGGYSTFGAVQLLMESEPVLLAGWGHFLAFDLLIGVMLADRMDRAGVARLVQAPALIMVFLFGPVGWLLGLATEWAARRIGDRVEG